MLNQLMIRLSGTTSVRRVVVNLVLRSRYLLPMALVALMISATAHAQDPNGPNTFNLTPASNAIADCLPGVTAKITVLAKEDSQGVDTLDLNARNLPPNTEFTVFLTELPSAPFGATQYIGDFTTNAQGRGALRVNTIVNEAFVSTVVNGVRVRKDLNHVVIWFADPKDDDFCLGTDGGVVTPFDGDGEAGVTVLSSASFLPGSPLP